jgi:hypothetical protein
MTICCSIWYNDLGAQTLRQAQSLNASVGLDLSADLLPAETNICAREVFTSISTLPETATQYGRFGFDRRLHLSRSCSDFRRPHRNRHEQITFCAGQAGTDFYG